MVLVLIGLCCRSDNLRVTSFVRVLNFRPQAYHRFLHLFHSKALDLDILTSCWVRLCLVLFRSFLVRGRLVVLADGIKAPKEGQRMPAVKSLHQKSGNNTKPEQIMGHSLQELKLRQDRQDRLVAMAAAKTKIAQRAQERYTREKAEFDEKMSKRQAKADETGKKPRGKTPVQPKPGVRDSDQINLTDEESRIMPVSGGGFEQCYNAQAGVDADTMLVVAATLTQAPNDKKEVQPILNVLQAQEAKLGAATTLIADTGYCSENNVKVCEEAKIVPLIAVARQDHHPHWSERFTEPAPLKTEATPVEAMTHRLTTMAGRAAYAIRKQTVEPVFGIIKSVMGFRQFSLRGLRKATGEWNLVCLAWNVKRMAVLRPKVG
jgi:hypothetical protein